MGRQSSREITIQNFPDPPIPAFLLKKQGRREKTRISFSAEALNSLEKGQTYKKNRKTKKARKMKKKRIGGLEGVGAGGVGPAVALEPWEVLGFGEFKNALLQNS